VIIKSTVDQYTVGRVAFAWRNGSGSASKTGSPGTGVGLACCLLRDMNEKRGTEGGKKKKAG